MARQRLTREESREQTRLRLLDAAAVVISKKGLAATSVEDIARHAGYTRGAFYSNFKSKTDLFIELLKRDHANVQQDLQALLDNSSSGQDLQQQLADFYGQCYGDNASYILWAEARLHAARDARFRSRFNTLIIEKRDVIAYFITRFGERLGKKQPPAPADALALAMMGLVDGVHYFRLIMPNEISEAAAQDVLSTIFNATFFGP